MTKSMRITGMGAALVDIIARVTEDEFAALGSVKGAMELIDPMRAEQLLSQITITAQDAGGSAANTVAGLAALDIPTGFIGALGADARGDFFAKALTQRGTKCLFVRSPQYSTGCSIIVVTPNSERTMHTLLGASTLIDDSQLDIKSLLTETQILFGEGYLWDSPQACQSFMRAAQALRAQGGQVVLALADPLCVARHLESLRKFCAQSADIVLANEKEACALYETDNFDDAQRAAEKQKLTGAFTRSAKGAVVFERGKASVVPAQPVPHIRDSTGAGDLFAAGYLAARLRGATPKTCGQLGVACGAKIITQFGARPATPLTPLLEELGI